MNSATHSVENHERGAKEMDIDQKPLSSAEEFYVSCMNLS